MKYRINEIQIEEGAESYPLTSEIKRQLSHIPVSGWKDEEETLFLKDHEMGKETLRLLPFKGEFLKLCPGTNNYICCGYQILNIGTNCPLDCSYWGIW